MPLACAIGRFSIFLFQNGSFLHCLESHAPDTKNFTKIQTQRLPTLYGFIFAPILNLLVPVFDFGALIAHLSLNFALTCSLKLQCLPKSKKEFKFWRLVDRRPDFAEIQNRIDPVDFRCWRRKASGATHAKRVSVNVAVGGAWQDQHCSVAFGVDVSCFLYGEHAGTLTHQTCECPLGLASRQAVSLTRVDGTPCLIEHGLVPPPPRLAEPVPQSCAFDIPSV